MTYQEFLDGKSQLSSDSGFEPIRIPESCHPFQRDLITWALRKGRAAMFADCGLGKTLMQLAWADNVHAHTGRRVLILTPLAVSHQTVREGQKFGIGISRSNRGELNGEAIVVTNYERLIHFNPDDFDGVVCDESSILKNFNGVTRHQVTDFMARIKYRLLCTATAAPNDYIELGTSCEALGVMRSRHMLAQYFTHDSGEIGVWRLKGHARYNAFWRWVCSWARAVRRPSDLGYEDGAFLLPELSTRQHIVRARTKNEEYLFDMPAVGLDEQRKERRRTIHERCEMAANLVGSHSNPAICWCHLNAEGDLLEKLTGETQVSGRDSDEEKEEKFAAFVDGKIRVLVTKPSIGGLGLNFQHCAHQTFFPSHSFEEWYQAIRRVWRYGQTKLVTVDVVSTEGEQRVLSNLEKKAAAADQMFSELLRHMNHVLGLKKNETMKDERKLPQWMM